LLSESQISKKKKKKSVLLQNWLWLLNFPLAFFWDGLLWCELTDLVLLVKDAKCASGLADLLIAASSIASTTPEGPENAIWKWIIQTTEGTFHLTVK
jgi:hypothetical protein